MSTLIDYHIIKQPVISVIDFKINKPKIIGINKARYIDKDYINFSKKQIKHQHNWLIEINHLSSSIIKF